MKKSISIILVLCLVLMTPSVAFASEAGLKGGDIGYEWKERSRSSTITNRGYAWSLCDPGSPATEAGETSTVTGSVSISASVGGTFKVPRNAILETETSIVDSATAYVYKPVLPQIKLEYHMSGVSENSIRTMNTLEPHRAEIYGWKDGAYQLLEVWNER